MGKAQPLPWGHLHSAKRTERTHAPSLEKPPHLREAAPFPWGVQNLRVEAGRHSPDLAGLLEPRPFACWCWGWSGQFRSEEGKAGLRDTPTPTRD